MTIKCYCFLAFNVVVRAGAIQIFRNRFRISTLVRIPMVLDTWYECSIIVFMRNRILLVFPGGQEWFIMFLYRICSSDLHLYRYYFVVYYCYESRECVLALHSAARYYVLYDIVPGPFYNLKLWLLYFMLILLCP